MYMNEINVIFLGGKKFYFLTPSNQPREETHRHQGNQIKMLQKV